MKASDPLVQAFRRVTFGMGSAAKRFARNITEWPPERELTPKAEAFAWRLAYIYRRQLPKEIVDEAMRRKVDHSWEPTAKAEFGMPVGTLKCSRCGRLMFSRREQNAPCPGAPEPKPARSTRKKAAMVVVVESEPLPDTQESLPWDEPGPTHSAEFGEIQGWRDRVVEEAFERAVQSTKQATKPEVGNA